MLTLLIITILTIINGCHSNTHIKAAPTISNPEITVTYDSRCIAIAYYRSQIHADLLKEWTAQHETGDEKLKKEINEKANKMQQLAHLQGFSTEPVDELLTRFQPQIELIMANYKATAICSCWLYKGDIKNTIDITDELAALYSPDEGTLKIIAAMKDKKPLPK
ncbi:MAG: hypothetical protein JW745_00695 [Sedimentisphaerales bacterium]|nr:hypothetical protein [Sedimentisphaerales bacterium]MBN2841663.1 hypothetical protein [Sedimentisphaerales bacterium]